MATADVIVPSDVFASKTQSSSRAELSPMVNLSELSAPHEPPRPALPQGLIDSAQVGKAVPFNPKDHLNFEHPKKILSMDELGLGGQGISSTGVSEPFQLFTEEAIGQMRAEIFSKPVLDKYLTTSSVSTHMIRGYCPQYGQFIHSAWHNAETLAYISKVAGVDLVPAIDYDVGHVNIAISAGTNTVFDEKEEVEAFAWHFDSYPFVCVTMLSDCTGMVGGETAIRTNTNGIMKVRGPNKGTAVVMQGRYIEHQALKARGGRERISMVTSLRPKCPLARDETVLKGVRSISDVLTLLTQFTNYRLENLEERVRCEMKELRKRSHAGHALDVKGLILWLKEQKEYIEDTLVELEWGN